MPQPPLLASLESKRCFGHRTSVSAVAWNKDGSHLLAGGDSSHVLVYHTERLQSSSYPEHNSLFECRSHTKSITSVTSSPTANDLFASASLDSTLSVFDTRINNRPIQTIHFPNACLHAQWCPDGNTIAVSLENDRISFVDCLSWAERSDRFIHTDTHIQKFTWSPDASQILVPTVSGSVKIFNWPTLNHIYTIRGNSSSVTSVACDPSHPRHFAVASTDTLLSIWDSQSMINLFTIDHWETDLNQVDFSNDGHHLIGVTGDFEQIDILDGLTGALLHSIPTFGPVNHISWHPSRTLLAYAPVQGGRDRFATQETGPPVCVWGFPQSK